MVKLDQIKHEVLLLEGVSASLDGDVLTIDGPNGSTSRAYTHPKVNVNVVDSKIVVQCELPRRKDKAICGTWRAHINNMVTGVTDGFEYKLKAVYSHFPMTLSVSGSSFEIKNLFGEKVPRVANLKWTPSEVQVKVENKSDVIVSGVDREKVGQTAAIIEKACRIRGRDRRIFQDGIYIVSKGAN
ncbi:MAG: 50S ribosomal protein L6 [Thermoplasmata archaeon]|nr:50S ribosomal protein L6 [Thermoplasmata archaeon]